MIIQQCHLKQIVCFNFGHSKRKGIVVGFGKNPVGELVPLVKWEDNKGVYQSAGLCHPKNIEVFEA